MFVPMDLLYDYLENLVNHDFVIYGFWPHGSKNLEHLVPKHDYTMLDAVTRPILIFHDQEPLNFELYQPENLEHTTWFKSWPNEFRQWWTNRNLRSACEVNIYDRCIVTHSEHRSAQVAKYQAQGFETVYVWSHALLSRDWYRYAMIDPKLQVTRTARHDFNIYARAWTGTREYRLYFLSLIKDIAQHCRTTFSTHDPDYYLDHKFMNSKYRIHNLDLENYFGNTSVSSNSSATYDADHVCSTRFDVVLETIYDQDRIHITEKTLRPIACGQAFILTAPAGSLEYLRGYGFKTFHSVLDESYDQEPDPVKRLQMIAMEMRRIARLSNAEKTRLMEQCQPIIEHNQRHFFGNDFFNQVVNEYIANMQQAMANVKLSKHGTELAQHLEIYNQWPGYKTHPDAAAIMEVLPAAWAQVHAA